MSSIAITGAARRSTQRPESARQERDQFTVLDARTLAERSRVRRARVIGLVAGAVLAASLATVAIGQDLVASQQVRLDNARQQLAQSIADEQQLQLRRAQLESPARILQIAEHQLHMIAPSSVNYLAPVSIGATLGGSGSSTNASSTFQTHRAG